MPAIAATDGGRPNQVPTPGIDELQADLSMLPEARSRYVEHRLPCFPVHGRRVREDTVEIEQAGAYAIGQSEHGHLSVDVVVKTHTHIRGSCNHLTARDVCASPSRCPGTSP